MIKGLQILLVATVMLIAKHSHAQYPRYFTYDDANGLPSTEVYSIIQDMEGSIWMGLDAGLYRFDGVRYHLYSSSSQKSKPVSGLTISASGKLYCFNFVAQLFVLENDTLKEVKHDLLRIIGLASDKKGNIIVGHWGGISIYNEANQTWKHHFHSDKNQPIYDRLRTSICTEGSLLDTISFINSAGFGYIVNGEVTQKRSEIFFRNSPEFYRMESFNGSTWIFSKEKNHIFKVTGNSIEEFHDPELLTILANRKITAINTLMDGNLWICTYKGIVCYNLQSKKAFLYYPELTFSDCFIDREGNYWFSTLHSGLLRIPNLNFIVWDHLENNRLVKLSTDGEHIFFATVNGTIGKLNTVNHSIETYHTSQSADVQSLDFTNNLLLFHINGKAFELKGSTVLEKESNIKAIKCQLHLDDELFRATSHGTYINDDYIDKRWSRVIKKGSNSSVWVATNEGLLHFEKRNNQWIIAETILEGVQIVSIDYDAKSQQLFVIDFNGKIYSVSHQNKLQYIAVIPSTLRTNRIAFYNEKLFIATNKGVHIYDLATQKSTSLDILSGLISDNIQDLVVVNSALWLATSKGLQKLPLNELHEDTPLARINLRNQQYLFSNLELNYDQPLILIPEVSMYKSNGNFEYAYHINANNEWIKLPSSIDSIELLNLPWGDFTVELKAIDHLGRDSANTVTLKGHINPPFWNTWWFALILASVFAFIVIYVANMIIRNIKKRESEKAELVKSQLTALKAQMNPHFMYNTLNSIQGLILKQDIKNSNLYLSKFSHLMRKVLDVSGREEISLHEEIQILELYLSLEKLRFGEDFQYTIKVSDSIDQQTTVLPPLILQPFAENAIKHGLLHKKGEKRLSIGFEKEHDLLCSIIDNGIGRKRATEIKERQQEKHESFSLNATQMRVNLLNRFSDKKFEITINDLYQDNTALGTEVSIRIPLEK